jgi:hypothetical protein
VVADSAGVRVVAYPAANPAATATPATATLRELVRIGAADGPPEAVFSELAGGRILDGGRLVLADRPSQEVRIFSLEGALLDRHGGEGEGPGEYRYIRGMGQCRAEGFTVFDIDWAMGHYGPDGAFLRQEPGGRSTTYNPYELACSPSGHRAVINWDRSRREGGPPLGFHVAMARLRILGPDGEERADLGERIGSERVGRPTGSGPHPAGRATRLAFHGDDLVVADGSFFGFERWTLDGRLREIVRVDVAPPDLDSLMAAYRDSTLARAGDEETSRRREREIAEMEGPEEATHVSALVVRGDRVLVREPSIGRSGRWFAFAADGAPLGFLPVPEGARLLDLRGDRLLVEERDALDVPQAVLYSLDGRGGGPD